MNLLEELSFNELVDINGGGADTTFFYDRFYAIGFAIGTAAAYVEEVRNDMAKLLKDAGPFPPR